MLPRAFPFLLLACASLVACAPDERGDDSAITEDDANLTAATATRLKVPLVILKAAFYVKPTPIDQSSLGVVLADGVAYADGATSQALPRITSLDQKPIAPLPSSAVEVGEERYGALFDFEGATSGPGERLLGKTAPPILAPDDVKAGMTCRVLGTEMDMYASKPPKMKSLEGTVDSVRSGVVLVKTTESTGGEMSLLVCNDKLAGIRAGAGSQGTWHEYHVLDDATVDAFAQRRDQCRAAGRCR